MAVPMPDESTRWRCAQCGNLTRFDVVRSRRTKEFWHFDLEGDSSVEGVELVSEDVADVVCRWCQTGASVELVARPAAGGPAEEGRTAEGEGQ